MGTGSNIPRLFTGRHKNSCTSNINIKSNISSRNEAITNRLLIDPKLVDLTETFYIY